MTVARIREDDAPKVARFKGEIAIYVDDGPEEHGFLLPPAVAVNTAVAMLGAVADVADALLPDGTPAFGHDVDGLEFKIAQMGLRTEGRLLLRLNGAPFTAILSEEQIDTLANTFASASAHLANLKGRPRHGV